MSGRSLHLRDGVLITNRKTDRRNPRRDPRIRLRELALGNSPDGFPIRVAFRLPKTLEGFVAPGQHGIGIQVLKGGFVRIGSHSAEQCFMSAGAFLATIARERPAFTANCVIINAASADKTYSRYLTVVRGCMVVSAGGEIAPRVYDAA